MNRYENNLSSRICAIAPDSYSRLEEVTDLRIEIADQIFALILQFVCCGQNVSSISAGKAAFKRLPRVWLMQRISSVAPTVLNFSDEWEYRRFLELLKECGSPLLLAEYVELGLKSQKSEIREAAQDFR